MDNEDSLLEALREARNEVYELSRRVYWQGGSERRHSYDVYTRANEVLNHATGEPTLYWGELDGLPPDELSVPGSNCD